MYVMCYQIIVVITASKQAVITTDRPLLVASEVRGAEPKQIKIYIYIYIYIEIYIYICV